MSKKEIMRKKTRIIFIFTGFFVFFVMLALTNGFVQAADNDKVLEITYPEIPGATTPKLVSIGLPEYVKYIFRFSVFLIGLVILGALIYSGIQYFTSFGNPEKLSAAKQGIISAFLGGIILLSAVLVFNTINPQLTILELPDVLVLEATVKPGIYLCNYKSTNISAALDLYISQDKERIDKGAELLKQIITVPEIPKQACYRVISSGNLKFVFKPLEHTYFTIPRKEYYQTVPAIGTEPARIGIKWEYDYGIIFHEKDSPWSRESKCIIAKFYDEIIPGSIGSGSTKVRAVTLFEKPEVEPTGGVMLYQCLNYNDTSLCPKDIGGVLGYGYFRTTNDCAENYCGKVNRSELEDQKLARNEKKDEEGARSIQFDPEGSYFAILFSEINFEGDICQVISNNDPNLLDQPIGHCAASGPLFLPGGKGYCHGYTGAEQDTIEALRDCIPCLQSMIVVKGKVIK